MAAPQNVSLMPFFQLTRGMQIRITALDPTSGDPVTGVVLSNMALSVDQDTGPPLGNANTSPGFLPGEQVLV